MIWVIYALSAALAWGFYGAMLHRGQVGLGNPMKALLCVGVAYFLIGVLAPVSTLAAQGALGQLQQRRCDVGHRERGAGSDRRGVHYHGLQIRRAAGVRDAAGVRRRATD